MIDGEKETIRRIVNGAKFLHGKGYKSTLMFGLDCGTALVFQEMTMKDEAELRKVLTAQGFSYLYLITEKYIN